MITGTDPLTFNMKIGQQRIHHPGRYHRVGIFAWNKWCLGADSNHRHRAFNADDSKFHLDYSGLSYCNFGVRKSLFLVI